MIKLDILLQFFRHTDFKPRMIDPNNQLIIITKLLSRLTKTRSHLKIQIIDGLTIGYELTILILKAN